MDSLVSFFQHIETLQNFLRHENEMLRTQHTRKALINKEIKENLWQHYQHAFDELLNHKVLNKMNKELVYHEMQELIKLTEENAHIIQNELKAYDRFVKRFADIKKLQQGNILKTYKSNGRVKKITNTLPLQTAAPIYHSINEIL